MSDKCEVCGSEEEDHTGSECFSRQLFQSEARAQELFEALVDVVQSDTISWAYMTEMVNKHAEHFRKGKP
jgi:hypothetical protein